MDDILKYNFGRWENLEDSHCEKCRATLSQQTTINIENINNVLIFALRLSDDFPLSDEDNEVKKLEGVGISGVSSFEPTIDGYKYELSAAIFHGGGKTFNSRHYTAIVRKNKKLFRANDTIITHTTWPMNSKDIYILFYTQIATKKNKYANNTLQ